MFILCVLMYTMLSPILVILIVFTFIRGSRALFLSIANYANSSARSLFITQIHSKIFFRMWYFFSIWFIWMRYIQSHILSQVASPKCVKLGVRAQITDRDRVLSLSISCIILTHLFIFDVKKLSIGYLIGSLPNHHKQQ